MHSFVSNKEGKEIVIEDDGSVMQSNRHDAFYQHCNAVANESKLIFGMTYEG